MNQEDAQQQRTVEFEVVFPSTAPSQEQKDEATRDLERIRQRQRRQREIDRIVSSTEGGLRAELQRANSQYENNPIEQQKRKNASIVTHRIVHLERLMLELFAFERMQMQAVVRDQGPGKRFASAPRRLVSQIDERYQKLLPSTHVPGTFYLEKPSPVDGPPSTALDDLLRDRAADLRLRSRRRISPDVPVFQITQDQVEMQLQSEARAMLEYERQMHDVGQRGVHPDIQMIRSLERICFSMYAYLRRKYERMGWVMLRYLAAAREEPRIVEIPLRGGIVSPGSTLQWISGDFLPQKRVRFESSPAESDVDYQVTLALEQAKQALSK